jgi:hypothetical protein
VAPAPGGAAHARRQARAALRRDDPDPAAVLRHQRRALLHPADPGPGRRERPPLRAGAQRRLHLHPHQRRHHPASISVAMRRSLLLWTIPVPMPTTGRRGSVIVYFCCFVMGFGPIPNILCADIFPTRVRGICSLTSPSGSATSPSPTTSPSCSPPSASPESLASTPSSAASRSPWWEDIPCSSGLVLSCFHT